MRRAAVWRRLLSPAGALAAFVVVVLVLDTLWLARYRSSAVPEYDEAGYISMALRDLHGWQDRGLRGLVGSFLTGAPSAPLVPLVTAFQFLVLGPSVAQSVIVQLLAVAGLAAATYALARTLLTPSWAALSAAVTIALPATTDFSRIFHFVVPAAALLTGAAWSLARSDGLRKPAWAALAGCLLGCMFLSRTMTVGYLPGIGGAAALMALATPGDRRRRLLSLGLLMGTTAVVPLPWLSRHGNARTVVNYLFGNGYDEPSLEYAGDASPLSLRYWSKQLHVLANDVHLPIATMLAAGLVAGLVTAVVRRTTLGGLEPRRALERLARSRLLIPGAIVVEGYLALTSSRNVGTAYALPWLSSAIILSVAGIASVGGRPLRRVLAAGLVGAALLAIVVKSDAVPALATHRSVHLPGVGTVTVTDGDWMAREDVEGAGYDLPPPSEPLPRLHRAWLPFATNEMKAVLRFLDDHDREASLVVATGDVVLSTTRFALAAELAEGRYVPVARIKPAPSRAAYAATLERARDTVVVTADPPPGGSDVQRATILAALGDAGFRPFRTGVAPDGRELTWWWWQE